MSICSSDVHHIEVSQKVNIISFKDFTRKTRLSRLSVYHVYQFISLSRLSRLSHLSRLSCLSRLSRLSRFHKIYHGLSPFFITTCLSPKLNLSQFISIFYHDMSITATISITLITKIFITSFFAFAQPRPRSVTSVSGN